MYALKNVIQYYKSHNSPIFSCFLDASKAFDRVNYWSLFKKLIQRGIPYMIVRLLSYWYESQQFSVKWANCTSSYFNTCNGVRQGGILSPRLFSLYLDDLSILLRNSQVGCYIDSTCTNHFFYADDMCILAPSACALQQLIDICQDYGDKHDILYNPIKSHCMTILPKRYNLTIPTVTLNNTELIYVEKVKYLGVILHESFKDDHDISRQLRCLYASSNTLLSKFSYCTQQVKLQLLQSYCLSFYCSTLWCYYSKQTICKLRVAYNDSASSIFVMNSVENFDAMMPKTYYKFRCRISVIDNNVIKCIISNNWMGSNYMWKHWNDLLHLNNQ